MKLRCVGVGWQYLMVTIIVVIETIICLLWEFITPDSPDVNTAENVMIGGKQAISCSFGTKLLGLVIWSIYNAGNDKSHS